MTNDRTLTEEFAAVAAAAAAASAEIVGRGNGSGFLEKTLRDALAERLPGARTEQPLNLDPAVWPGRLGGVDVLYVPAGGIRIGVETKVWDVADSLYDILKLAAGVQTGTVAAGFCVIAGRSRDWGAPSAIRNLSDPATGEIVVSDVAAVLQADQRGWAHIWSRAAIRPRELPAQIRTLAGKPIALPAVPDHQIRVVGVQAVGRDRLRLDLSGTAC